MYSHQDHYIHELTVETISNILENGAWKADNQQITSAITDTIEKEEKELDEKQVTIGDNTDGIYAFSDIKFDNEVKRMLDVGGGKFDFNRSYMKRKKNIDLLVWDPYNRSTSHIMNVQAEVVNNKVDAATSMSVLNVIPEPEVRLAHINTLKAALTIGGKAYFKIWLGKLPLQETYLPSATESSYQANAYADRFLKEIEIVFGIENVRIDKTVPNLIVAIKLTEDHTTQHDIIRIQKESEKELILLTKVREKSISNLYSRNDIIKLFSTNLSFFKKMEDKFIEQYRHTAPKLQHEYDKSHGLVLYKK